MDLIKKRYRSYAYVAGFFLSIHLAFPSYFNSSFLGRFLSEGNIGLIFSLASFLSILALSNISGLIARYGKLKVAVVLSVINILITFPLIWETNGFFVILFFLFYYTLAQIIKFDLDLYLETISDDQDTGRIRGIYLTALNTAWLISPLFAGILIEKLGFDLVYVLASAALLPFIYILIYKVKDLNPNQEHKISIRESILNLISVRSSENKNLYNILVVDFLLNFFYAIMVVYTALYLENHIGLSKAGIGIAFTIMLMPFVMFEYPLGKIADKILGEKELLIGGLLLTGLATLLIPFITTKSILVWSLVLFLTRVGACMIEIMKETYLFKKIEENNTDIIYLSRINMPFSYIIGPIIGSIFISFWDLKYLFVFLGLVMIFGIRYASRIEDTL